MENPLLKTYGIKTQPAAKPATKPKVPPTPTPAQKQKALNQQVKNPNPFQKVVQQTFNPQPPPQLGPPKPTGIAALLASQPPVVDTQMQAHIRRTQPITANQGFAVGRTEKPSLEREMAEFDIKLFGKETYGTRPKNVSEADWKRRTAYRQRVADRQGWKAENRIAQEEELNQAIEAGKIENFNPAQRLALAQEAASGLPGFYDKERASALAAKHMGEMPNLAGLDDGGLALNAINQAMSPVSTAKSIIGKDPRAMAELPDWEQAALTIGDIAAQVGLGAMTGGTAQGSALARVGQLATKYLAMDIPGYTQMIRDAGGYQGALGQYGGMIKDSLDFSKQMPMSQRIQGMTLALALGLGGAGQAARLKGAKPDLTTPTPDLPTKPLDVEAPPVRLDFDPVADAYSKWQGMDAEEVPSPKPKAARKPKAEPSPEKAGVSNAKPLGINERRAAHTLKKDTGHADYEGSRVDRMKDSETKGHVFRTYEVRDKARIDEATDWANSNDPEKQRAGREILKNPPPTKTAYAAFSQDGSKLFTVTKTEFDNYKGAKASGLPKQNPKPATSRYDEARNARDSFYESLEDKPTPKEWRGTRAEWLGHEEREFALREFPDLYERNDVGQVVLRKSPSTPNAPTPKITGQAEAVPPPTPKPTGNPSRGTGRAAGAKVADQPAPEPVKAEVGAPKEAWEMTREEWIGKNMERITPLETDRPIVKALKMYAGNAAMLKGMTPSDIERVGVWAGIVEHAIKSGKPVARPIVADYMAITGRDQYGYTKKGGKGVWYEDQRLAEVSADVAKGRPVPASVLADYPDLKPKQVEVGKPKEAWEMTREDAKRLESNGSLLTPGGTKVFLSGEGDQLKAQVFNPTTKEFTTIAEWQEGNHESLKRTGAAISENARKGLSVEPIVRGIKTAEFYIASKNGEIDWSKSGRVGGYSKGNLYIGGEDAIRANHVLSGLSLDRKIPSYTEAEWKAAVAKALSEGKPVPASVLADYPDLKPKQAEGATQGKPKVQKGAGKKEPWEMTREEVIDKYKDALEYGPGYNRNIAEAVGDLLDAIRKGDSKAQEYFGSIVKQRTGEWDAETAKAFRDSNSKAYSAERNAQALKEDDEKFVKDYELALSDNNPSNRQISLSKLTKPFTEELSAKQGYADMLAKHRELGKRFQDARTERGTYRRNSKAWKAADETVLEIGKEYDAVTTQLKDAAESISKSARQMLDDKYKRLTSPTSTNPSTSRTAQTKAKLDEAIENFKTEHGKLHAVSNPKQEAAKLASTVDLLKALLDHAAASAGEFVLKTADDFIKFTGKRLGRDLTAGEVARHKKAWEQVHKGQPVVKPPKNPLNAEGATGGARRFEDPERIIKGFDPTHKPGTTADRLADSVEGIFTTNKASNEIARVLDAKRKGVQPTPEGIALVTRHKRDLMNEANDIYKKMEGETDQGKLNDLLDDLSNTEKQLDRVSDYFQESRTLFHSVGQALQIAYEPDYTVASIAIRAKAANLGVDLEPRIMDRLKSLVGRLEAAEAKLAAIDNNAEIFEAIRKQSGVTKPRSSPEADVVAARLRTGALSKLKSLGFKVNENVPAGGGMKSKESGAVVTFNPMGDDAKRAIRQLAKSYLVNGSATDLNGVLKNLHRDVSGFTADDFLSSLYQPYEKNRLEADTFKRAINAQVRGIQADAALRQLDMWGKSKKLLGAVIGGGTRSAQLGIDASASLLQGAPMVLSRHWVGAWVPAAKAMFGDLDLGKNPGGGVKIAAHRAMAKIEADPDYAKAVKAKLGLTDIEGKLNGREEAIASDLFKRMAENGWPVAKQLASVYERFTAAYAAFLNHLRFQVFKDMAKHAPDDPEALRDAARIINIFTGRGDGKVAEFLGHPVAGTVAIAPRFMWSNFQMAAGSPFVSATTPTGRKLALGAYAKALAFMGIVYSLNRATGGTEETDPRHTSFGAITMRDGTRINFFGKWLQLPRLIARMSFGTISNNENQQAPDAYGGGADLELGRFISGKASPAAKLGLGLLTGFEAPDPNDDSGKWKPQSRGQIIRETTTPLGVRNIIDNYRKTGWWSGLEFFGPNVTKVTKKPGYRTPIDPQTKGFKQLIYDKH